jgi:nucleotide-binding universal stress UspA family protein
MVKGDVMTPLFEKILIATDGSERNQPAVKMGLDICRVCGSALYAIYVIDETPMTSAQADMLTGDIYLKLKDEGEEAVEQVKRMAHGVKVEALVLSGRPAHVITEFAAKNGVDLIVVGSQGKSGLERLILGSIAESIIRMADCMVLVVKK